MDFEDKAVCVQDTMTSCLIHVSKLVERALGCSRYILTLASHLILLTASLASPVVLWFTGPRTRDWCIRKGQCAMNTRK